MYVFIERHLISVAKAPSYSVFISSVSSESGNSQS